MSEIQVGILVGLVAFAAVAAGCSDDSSGGGAGGSAATAGTGSSGASAGAGIGGSAGSSSGGGTAGSGTAGSGTSGSGGGASGGCKLLQPGQTGAHNLSLVYESSDFGTFYSALGIEGGYVYFRARSALMRYPVAGGSAEQVGTLAGSRHVLHGGTVYWQATEGVEPTGDLVSAPLTDVATTTTLAEGVETFQHIAVDGTAVYYDRREPPAIMKVPLTGGSPAELVPGGNPLGMVTHNGSLYWLDFETTQLERVPAAGGARTQLAEVFFGGPMVALGDSVYWADTSLNTVERWTEGATTTNVLASASGSFDGPENLAVAGDTVYWAYGFTCGGVRRVGIDGSGEALFVQGVDGPEWIGATDTQLFVVGRGGLYRADR